MARGFGAGLSVGIVLALTALVMLQHFYGAGGWLASTVTVTETVVHTVTRELTLTRETTVTVRETVPPLTHTVTLTVTRTVTETKTATVVSETVTVTQTVSPMSPPRSIVLPVCEGYDPQVFDERSVLCGLSQASKLRSLAASLTAGDWWSTAVSIAHWVAENIEYRRDYVAHGVREYVQMPLETLELRSGDCEDRALLAAALMAATGLFDAVVLVRVDYAETDISHVDPGIIVNGRLYIVPVVLDTYPALATSDYYGLWADSGLRIVEATVYSYDLSRGRLDKHTISAGMFSTMYPPPVTRDHLEETRRAVEEYLETLGIRVHGCPSYLRDLADYMARYLPARQPPPIVSYYMVVHPVDWYSPHPPSWVAKRITTALTVNKNLTRSLGELGAYETCVYVHVEHDEARVRVYKYTPDGTPIPTEATRPVIAIYILVAPDYPVPKTIVEEGEKTITITVETAGEVNILVYELGSPKPFLGISPPGYYYPGLITVQATAWSVEDNRTVITVDRTLLDKHLAPNRTYMLVVWAENKQAYILLYQPGA